MVLLLSRIKKASHLGRPVQISVLPCAIMLPMPTNPSQGGVGGQDRAWWRRIYA